MSEPIDPAEGTVCRRPPRKNEKKSKKEKLTREEILALKEPDGWMTAFRLLRKYKIHKPEEMKSLEEFKQLLLNHFQPDQKDVYQHDFSPRAAIIEEKKHIILEIYRHLEEFTAVKQFTDSVKSNIDGRVENWMDKLVRYTAELKSGYCPILVAGETGAGKSSFINLLIGEDILPVDAALSTTSCICEVHHGNKKEVFAYLTEPKLVPQKEGDVLHDHDHMSLEGKEPEEVRRILSQFAHEDRDKEDGFMYKKVVINWPIPFLRAGLFLVDSPGLGEKGVVDERAKEYVHEAVAFIYLLNSEAAGGFTEGRLETLLTLNTSQTDESNLRKFDPRSALFIFNKWHKISDEMKMKIRVKVLDKIRLKWPKLDEESQIHYLDVKTATNCQRTKIGYPPEYEAFLKIFYSFLEKGLDLMVFQHLRWLDHLLNNAETCVHTPLTMAKRSGKVFHEKMSRISNCLRKLKEETEAVVAGLHRDLEHHMTEIATVLCEHLRSPSTFERLKKGAIEAELPADLDMKLNKAFARDIIKHLLMNETSEWEDKTHMIQKAQEKVRAKLVSEFEIVSDELARIERDMKGPSNFAPAITKSKERKDFKDKIDHVFTGTEKAVIGFTSPLWMPLAVVAGVLFTPIVGTYTLMSQIAAKYRLAKFRKARDESMEKWLTAMTKNLSVDGVKRDVVQEKMKIIYDFILQFQLSVPAIIESNQKLIEKARTGQSNTEEILRKYDPLRMKLDVAFGLRNMYYYNYMLASEHNVYTDSSTVSDEKFIASGTFADVYSGCMDKTVEGYFFCALLPRGRPVALKKFRALVDETNVTDLMLERDILTRLSLHCNIVALYGTMCTKDESGKHMAFIMELCDGTLRQDILAKDENIPAKQSDTKDRKQAAVYITDKLTQVCHGVAFLHENDFVHRDLKLDNILVTNGIVKLCDLGQNKAGKDVFGSKIMATPKYMDPNILKAQYVQFEADVYSLAMIIWECWYGREIFDQQEWNDELQEEVVKGLRPSFDIPDCVRPFHDYIDLIKRCWTLDAYERPVVEEIKDILISMNDALQTDYDMNELCFTSEKLAHLTHAKPASSLDSPLPIEMPPPGFDSIDSVKSNGPILPKKFNLSNQYTSSQSPDCSTWVRDVERSSEARFPSLTKSTSSMEEPWAAGKFDDEQLDSADEVLPDAPTLTPVPYVNPRSATRPV